jgi:hypothetical protein
MAAPARLGAIAPRVGGVLDEDQQADLRNQLDAQQRRLVVYSADGAVDPTFSHVAMITKGSAAAMTLAAPTTDGTVIEFQAGSAFAHVLTLTGLLEDGVTGGSKNTYTTAAFVGSGGAFMAYNGHWHLLRKNLGATA